jgi:hypothetical protein
MQLTGHKTRSVFERYNIVNDADLRTAARKLNDICWASAAKSREKRRPAPHS